MKDKHTFTVFPENNTVVFWLGWNGIDRKLNSVIFGGICTVLFVMSSWNRIKASAHMLP